MALFPFLNRSQTPRPEAPVSVTPVSVTPVSAPAASAEHEPVRVEVSPPANPPTGLQMSPRELRQLIFEAARGAAAGDDQTLRRICKAHSKTIRAQILVASSVPAAIRANPTLFKWYRDGLIAISALCPPTPQPRKTAQTPAASAEFSPIKSRPQSR